MQLIDLIFYHSVISYGNLAWGSAHNDNLTLLQINLNELLWIIRKKKVNFNVIIQI